MPKKSWWPGPLADQALLMQNFKAKIGSYASPLSLTAAEIAAAQDLCSAFIQAFNITEQCRATMLALTQWRDGIFDGTQTGSATPAAPVFPVVGPVSYTQGTIRQFFELRDRIIAAAGYTQAIGEDLGLVGAEASRPAAASITPALKTVTSTGFWVNLTGSMQGMDALRVEYSRDGGENFKTVAFLTTTPAGFQITPATPNQPERGVIRAIYLKKNEETGRYSANYPVTLS